MFTKYVKHSESKGVFTHDPSTCYFGVIVIMDNKSSLVQAISQCHTHVHRVHYLDQWFSLVKLNTMSQMIFSPMSTSTYYLSIKHNWQQVSIGPDSIPTSYTWSTGTLPGPLMLIIHIKRSEIKGIFTHDTSSYFLGISGNTWTFGSGSIPASYKWSTGTLPGPMIFTCEVKHDESNDIFTHEYINLLLKYKA